MSGLAGYLWLDGRPAEPGLLHRMTAAIAHRGPDGIRHQLDGPAALGHARLCTTPESLAECQPLWDEARACCLTLDGRVDNREDLARDLKSRGAILRDATDAELVLKSWLVWGPAAPARLLGDFAFVLWDRRRRELFCARDHLGLKPLYYVTAGRRFLWASEIQPFFTDPAIPRRPNEGMIAEHLVDAVTSVTETLYAGIFRLAPAHSLTVSETGLVQRRYWRVEEAPRLRLASDDDRAACFTAVFTEAVRCRLRSHCPLAAELSGGVDSSAVVSVAAPLAPGLETYSMSFPGLPCDEGPYIDAVTRCCRVPNHRLAPPPGPDAYVRSAARWLDLPDQPNTRALGHLRRLAVDRGARVMLTGEGGDDLFGSHPDPAARLRSALVRSLPPPARRLLRRVRARHSPACGPYSWVEPGLAARTRLAGRIARPAWPAGFTSYILGLQERSAAARGIELRHPFYDRRLFELAEALPASQFTRNGVTKWIVRRALRGVLPESVRARTDKAGFSHLFARDLAGRPCPAIPWIRPGRFSQALSDYAGCNRTGAFYPYIWPVWMAFAVDFWYQAVFPSKGQDIEEETVLHA